MSEAHENLQRLVDGLGITAKFSFVPFSRSRSKAGKTPSLNYEVTLSRNGRDFLNFDYTKGCGHCPSAKLTKLTSNMKRQAAELECETGLEAQLRFSRFESIRGKKIEPSLVDVVGAVLCDAEALNHSSFEDWASDFGYDTDSRKAEEAYNQCVKTGLALLACVGHVNLTKMQELAREL